MMRDPALLSRLQDAGRTAASLGAETVTLTVPDLQAVLLELKILGKRALAHEELPFCPDHRDKVRGRPCRECEVERLAGENERLKARITPQPAERQRG